MKFTEKELIEFTNYCLDKNSKYVSDADLRNFFGYDYDSIKYERKEKLENLKNKLQLST